MIGVENNDNGNARMRTRTSTLAVDAEGRSSISVNSDGTDWFSTVEAADRPDGVEQSMQYMDPFQLPQSTHTLLFTEPVFSIPFAFAMAIIILSVTCLYIAFHSTTGIWELVVGVLFILDFPANVGHEVRITQYLAIFIIILMEEEIPTGLYLLRMLPKEYFQENFPDKKHSKFIFSCLVRIILGHIFLVNAVCVVAMATDVLDIFYDVLALQFVQQLDDIAFTLAKMDALGVKIRRACTGRCFQTEVRRVKFESGKGMRIFLKMQYFFSLGWMLAFMALVNLGQESGYFQCNSIKVDFGSAMWEGAIVNMPSAQYETWVGMYPFYNGTASPDQEEKWMLVFSSFNGVYEQDGKRDGAPSYKERRKFDGEPYSRIVPAEIRYCKDINSWVFTHNHIRKTERITDVESGCNWLLRSQETEEFDLMNVAMDWKIWTGVIGNADLSYSCNDCTGDEDCNFNGQCVDGTRGPYTRRHKECTCYNEDGVEYLGTHCETKLENSCRSILGERYNEPLSVSYYNMDSDGIVKAGGPLDTLWQQYSRPVYLGPNGSVLLYTGNRWVSFDYPHENATEQLISDWISESHAFWGRSYDSKVLLFISDETKNNNPVGVDFYEIKGQGQQFGPFGLRRPIQLNNETGRGYYRCGGPISSLGNTSVPDNLRGKLRSRT